MKKWIVILGIVVVFLIGALFLSTGGVRTDVFLNSFEVSEDGKVMTMNVGVTSSAGYLRKMKQTSGSMNPYLTFYSTFGINSKLGANDIYTIELDENMDEIYFYKGDRGYIKVLEKDKETGEWKIIRKNEETKGNQNSIAKEINLGETVSVDLDGDGKLENIYYSLDDFKINEVSYKKDIEDVYLDNPDQHTFIVVDLDKKDNQKEIVLKVEGPSDDPVAHFYTYKNGLIKLGKAETALSYTSFDGDGNFYGDVRLDILQTWFAPETWSLKNNKIVRNADHIYYPNQYIGSKVILKKELPIHENLTDSTEPIIVKPQEVKITRTDNKKFCYLEATDGTAGWFEVADFFKIVELDNEIATNVFEGLCMAD